VGQAIHEALRELLRLTPEELAEDRYRRFRALGAFVA
jgi:acetyl-CoA carboxylase alpha subunit